MQILLIMLIVVLLAFLVLLLALAKQSPREKQTEDKEQEEYIRDYAETVRQTGGSMKKLEHWKVIAIYLIIYDVIAVNFSYFMALLVRFDFRYMQLKGLQLLMMCCTYLMMVIIMTLKRQLIKLIYIF